MDAKTDTKILADLLFDLPWGPRRSPREVTWEMFLPRYQKMDAKTDTKILADLLFDLPGDRGGPLGRSHWTLDASLRTLDPRPWTLDCYL